MCDLNSRDSHDIRSFDRLSSIPYIDILNDLDLDCSFMDEKAFVKSFSNSNNIKIISLNIQSIVAKFSEFNTFFDKLAINKALPDFFLLQETFAKDFSFLGVKGFKPVFDARPQGSRGGGTAIYCSDEFNIKHLSSQHFFLPNILEATVIIAEVPGKYKLLLASVYRPNTHLVYNNNQQIDVFLESIGEFLEILNEYNLTTLVCGDFNLNLFLINDSNSKASAFLDIFGGFGFLNVITKASRIANNSYTALDQIFINDISFLRRSGVMIDSMSNHFACFAEINLNKPKPAHDPYRSSRSFTLENLNHFKTSLLNQSWVSVLDNICVHSACENFMKIFFELYEICFPVSRVKINKKFHPVNPFMSKALLVSRAQNLKLSQVAKRFPTDVNKNIYKSYRLIYNRLVRAAKKNYYNRKIQNAGSDSKKLWSSIKEAINIPSKNNVIGPVLNDENVLLHDDVAKANYFNTFFSSIGIRTAQFIPTTNISFADFLPPPCQNSLFLRPIAQDCFADFTLSIKPKLSNDINGINIKFIQSIIHEIKLPLTYIFNLSIETGTFPNALKTSKCIPIYKNKGDKTLLDNYRLVCLVDNFSKPFEKIMCSRLIDFLNDNNFFVDSQFGFRKRLSTKHAILAIINFITKNLNQNKYVLAIFLDVMKAFDSVKHDILFSKLENAGVRGIALDWFKSYFENRFQKVYLNGVFSSNICRIILGVLQGSILGVILFIIMINDIHFSCPELFSIIFADDDTSLVEDVSLESVIEKANLGLSKLVDWYSCNSFAIHPSKSKCMLFHNSNRRKPTVNENINDPLIVVREGTVSNTPYLPIFINLNNEGEFNITKISLVRAVPNNDEDSIKVLGFLLDDKLNLKPHIDYIYSKISRSLYSLKQMRNILDCRHLKLLFCAYVKSHVDYADIFYCLATKKTLYPLEIIYKKAIRIVSGANYRDHTKPLFVANKILPINKNSELNILKIMFRCDRDDIPNCIKDNWRRNRDVSGREGRNADHFYQETINVKYLENSPLFYFPKLYNDLPNEIKLVASEKEFIKEVKHLLFERLEGDID